MWKLAPIDFVIDAWNAEINNAEDLAMEVQKARSHELLRKLRMPEDEAIMQKRYADMTLEFARMRDESFINASNKRVEKQNAERCRAVRRKRNVKPLKLSKDERWGTWARSNHEGIARHMRRNVLCDLIEHHDVADDVAGSSAPMYGEHSPILGASPGDTDDDLTIYYMF